MIFIFPWERFSTWVASFKCSQSMAPCKPFKLAACLHVRNMYGRKDAAGLNLEKKFCPPTWRTKFSCCLTNTDLCQSSFIFNMKTVLFCLSYWQTLFDNNLSFKFFGHFGGKTDVKVEACRCHVWFPECFKDLFRDRFSIKIIVPLHMRSELKRKCVIPLEFFSWKELLPVLPILLSMIILSPNSRGLYASSPRLRNFTDTIASLI